MALWRSGEKNGRRPPVEKKKKKKQKNEGRKREDLWAEITEGGRKQSTPSPRKSPHKGKSWIFPAFRKPQDPCQCQTKRRNEEDINPKKKKKRASPVFLKKLFFPARGREKGKGENAKSLWEDRGGFYPRRCPWFWTGKKKGEENEL